MSPSKRARQVPRAHCLAGLKAWKMKKSASMATDDPQNNAEANNAGSSEGDYTLSLPAVPPTQQPASNNNNASEGGRDDPNDDKEDDNDSDESSMSQMHLMVTKKNQNRQGWVNFTRPRPHMGRIWSRCSEVLQPYQE